MGAHGGGLLGRGLEHGGAHGLVVDPVGHRLHQLRQQRGRAVDELAELVHLRAHRAVTGPGLEELASACTCTSLLARGNRVRPQGIQGPGSIVLLCRNP